MIRQLDLSSPRTLLAVGAGVAAALLTVFTVIVNDAVATGQQRVVAAEVRSPAKSLRAQPAEMASLQPAAAGPR
jgi:hypothetical protein